MLLQITLLPLECSMSQQVQSLFSRCSQQITVCTMSTTLSAVISAQPSVKSYYMWNHIQTTLLTVCQWISKNINKQHLRQDVIMCHSLGLNPTLSTCSHSWKTKYTWVACHKKKKSDNLCVPDSYENIVLGLWFISTNLPHNIFRKKKHNLPVIWLIIIWLIIFLAPHSLLIIIIIIIVVLREKMHLKNKDAVL